MGVGWTPKFQNFPTRVKPKKQHENIFGFTSKKKFWENGLQGTPNTCIPLISKGV
jgi:hypothetical protein